MSAFEVLLGPKAMGAEVLVHMGKRRLTGRLSFGPPSKRRHLLFKDGRPEAVVELGGASLVERNDVVAAVRAFGALSAGRCVFMPEAVPVSGASLAVDTLGEAMVSVLKTMSAVQLDAFWEARGRFRGTATPFFGRLSDVVARMLGEQGRLSPLRQTTLMSQVIANTSPHEQRGWAAMIVMGAITTDAPPISFTTPPTAVVANSGAAASSASGSSTSVLPRAQDEDEATRMARDIREAFARDNEVDHYRFLDVSRDATAGDVRKAYFRLAKEWHGDRLAGLGVPIEVLKMAEDLFRRAEEANRILSDEDERKSYDWVLERQAKGLPTDPKTILEAESIFRRAEGLVRRGQAAAAEPLLRQAVQMNKGEADFWAFLGFAIYSTQGHAGLNEARQALNTALAERNKLDVAYEFLGRIAHAEGDIDTARVQLQKCLEHNPKNADAKRELRLLSMRQNEREAAKAKSKEKTGLFSKLLKR